MFKELKLKYRVLLLLLSSWIILIPFNIVIMLLRFDNLFISILILMTILMLLDYWMSFVMCYIDGTIKEKYYKEIKIK
jgi:hypothetical protein